MRTLQRELYLLSAVALLLSFAAHAAGAQSHPALQFGAAQLRAENGDSVAADTATLLVRENRDQPASRRIAISVVRLRGATPAARSAPPIIYVSGGSGAGISAARGARFPFFTALRTAADVIVFDTRGAGRSAPRLSCNARLAIDMTLPLTRDMLVTATRDANRTCADSLRARGFDLSGYNGAQMVADIDELRAALGVGRVSLLGTSARSVGCRTYGHYIRSSTSP